MNLKSLFGSFIRVVLSVIFSGIFYVAWLAVGLTVFKSGLGGIVLKAVIWIAAPVVTFLALHG